MSDEYHLEFKELRTPEHNGLIRRGPGRLKAVMGVRVQGAARTCRAGSVEDQSDHNDFMRISGSEGSEVSSRKLAQCLLLGQRVIVGQLEKCWTTTWVIVSSMLVLNQI